MFFFKSIHFQRLQVSVVQLLQLTLLLPIYECLFTSPYWSVAVLPVQDNHMKLVELIVAGFHWSEGSRKQQTHRRLKKPEWLLQDISTAKPRRGSEQDINSEKEKIRETQR